MSYTKQDGGVEFGKPGPCMYPLNSVEIEEEVEGRNQSTKNLACLQLRSLARMPYKKQTDDGGRNLRQFPRKAVSSLRWLKNKLMCMRNSSNSEMPGIFYRGDSLRMYHTQRAQPECESMLESTKSGDSCEFEETTVSPEWDSQACSLQFDGSEMLSEEPGCLEEAISCSKTDFGHFAHVLDNGKGDPFGTLWKCEHGRGVYSHSSSDGVQTPGFGTLNNEKMVSQQSIDSYSSTSDIFRPCTLDIVEENEVTPKHIKKLIKTAHPGDVVDLMQRRIEGSGCLVISTPGLVVKNGHLDYSGGVMVKAEQVQLLDLKITSSAMQANALSILSSDCTVMGCAISSVDGAGVLVEGAGSNAMLKKCRIHDCYGNCVWVAKGAHLSCKMSEICRSTSFHGLSAENRGTVVKLSRCRIHENHQDGIFVTSGSEVFADGCEIWGSKTFHGISVKKRSSYMRTTHCKIFDNMQSCVFVGEGGKLDMYICEAWGAVTYGLMCDGEGSTMRLTKTHIFDSNLDNVRLTDQSVLKANNSAFHGSKLANGIAILSGSQCILKTSDISCSALAGIWVGGNSSTGSFYGTQMRDNEICNLFVDGGAWATLADCKLYGAKLGSAVAVKGMGSQVHVSTSIVHSNPVGNYTALLWTRLCIDGMQCRGSKPWQASWIRHLSTKTRGVNNAT